MMTPLAGLLLFLISPEEVDQAGSSGRVGHREHVPPDPPPNFAC